MIFIHQKFGEIPLDGAAKETRLLFFQKFVQWNGATSVYIDLIFEKKELI